MRFGFRAAVFAALCLVAHSLQAAQYDYPYHDPYLATTTVAALGIGDGSCARSEIVHVPGLPGRDDLPTVEGRGNFSISLCRRSGPAPLMFILGGLGSNAFFGVGPYFADLFHRGGFHVAVLPSPMSWNFALSASRSGAPGYTPEDARDLYNSMQTTLATLRSNYGVETTETNFMAVSLGALEGAYLSLIDADEGKIGIARYLLINPPIDLLYGIKKLDQWNALGRKFGPTKAQTLVSQALAIVDSVANEKSGDPEVVARMAKQFSRFSTEELQFLIAKTLESQMPELVYVTQVIHDQGVLKAPREDKRRRLDQAMAFDLTQYMEKIAVPIWRKSAEDPTADPESFIQRGTLAPILTRLRANPKVHIMHNADDFLAESQSLESLKQALGSQLTVYPYGGHLGNLWFPKNKEDILRFFGVTP